MVEVLTTSTKRKWKPTADVPSATQPKKQKIPAQSDDDFDTVPSASSSRPPKTMRKNAVPGPGPSTSAASAAAAGKKFVTGSSKRKRAAGPSTDDDDEYELASSSDSVPDRPLYLASKRAARHAEARATQAKKGLTADESTATEDGKGKKKKTYKRIRGARPSALVNLGSFVLNSDGEDVEELAIRRERARRRKAKNAITVDDNDPIECSSPHPLPRSSPVRTREEGGVISILSSDEEDDEAPPSSPLARPSRPAPPRKSSPSHSQSSATESPPPATPGRTATPPRCISPEIPPRELTPVDGPPPLDSYDPPVHDISTPSSPVLKKNTGTEKSDSGLVIVKPKPKPRPKPRAGTKTVVLFNGMYNWRPAPPITFNFDAAQLVEVPLNRFAWNSLPKDLIIPAAVASTTVSSNLQDGSGGTVNSTATPSGLSSAPSDPEVTRPVLGSLAITSTSEPTSHKTPAPDHPESVSIADSASVRISGSTTQEVDPTESDLQSTSDEANLGLVAPTSTTPDADGPSIITTADAAEPIGHCEDSVTPFAAHAVFTSSKERSPSESGNHAGVLSPTSSSCVDVDEVAAEVLPVGDASSSHGSQASQTAQSPICTSRFFKPAVKEDEVVIDREIRMAKERQAGKPSDASLLSATMLSIFAALKSADRIWSSDTPQSAISNETTSSSHSSSGSFATEQTSDSPTVTTPEDDCVGPVGEEEKGDGEGQHRSSDDWELAYPD